MKQVPGAYNLINHDLTVTPRECVVNGKQPNKKITACLTEGAIQESYYVLALFQHTGEQCYCPAIVESVNGDTVLVGCDDLKWTVSLRPTSQVAVISKQEYEEYHAQIIHISTAIVNAKVFVFRQSANRFQKAFVQRFCGLREFEVWFSDGEKLVVPQGFIVHPTTTPIEDIVERRHSDGQIRCQSKLCDATGRQLMKGDAVIAPASTKPEAFQLSRVFDIVDSLLQLHFDDLTNHLVPANVCYFVPITTYDLVVAIMKSKGERLVVPRVDEEITV